MMECKTFPKINLNPEKIDFLELYLHSESNH